MVGSDLAGLAPALKRLCESSPSEFLGVLRDLLNTEQFSMLVLGRQPDTYPADGMVFGAT